MRRRSVTPSGFGSVRSKKSTPAQERSGSRAPGFHREPTGSERQRSLTYIYCNKSRASATWCAYRSASVRFHMLTVALNQQNLVFAGLLEAHLGLLVRGSKITLQDRLKFPVVDLQDLTDGL